MTDRNRRSAIQSKRGFWAHRRRGLRSRLKTTPFDAAVYLDSPEDVEEFLKVAAAQGDEELIRHAKDIVARARAKFEAPS